MTRPQPSDQFRNYWTAVEIRSSILDEVSDDCLGGSFVDAGKIASRAALARATCPTPDALGNPSTVGVPVRRLCVNGVQDGARRAHSRLQISLIPWARHGASRNVGTDLKSLGAEVQQGLNVRTVVSRARSTNLAELGRGLLHPAPFAGLLGSTRGPVSGRSEEIRPATPTLA